MIMLGHCIVNNTTIIHRSLIHTNYQQMTGDGIWKL